MIDFDFSAEVKLYTQLKSVYEPITDMYRYRPIIGFADMKISYRYRLSVSADTKPHIGNLADMLN